MLPKEDFTYQSLSPLTQQSASYLPVPYIISLSCCQSLKNFFKCLRFIFGLFIIFTSAMPHFTADPKAPTNRSVFWPFSIKREQQLYVHTSNRFAIQFPTGMHFISFQCKRNSMYDLTASRLSTVYTLRANL